MTSVMKSEEITSTGKVNTIKTIFKRIKDFILVPPFYGESIFQFILRQFLIPDSQGNPSITITISSVVTGVCIYVVSVATQIALTPIKKYDPTTGKLIYEGLQGLPTEFYALIITMFGVVTYLYKSRQESKTNLPDNSELDTSSIISKIMELINKIKTK